MDGAYALMTVECQDVQCGAAKQLLLVVHVVMDTPYMYIHTVHDADLWTSQSG